MTDINDQRDTRNQYGATPLERSGLADSPFEQFSDWLAVAKAENVYDYTAMTLATANATGQPSARVVLLKHFDTDGFCWYTDQGSQKGQELAQNPQAALLFFWPELHRQIRVEGAVLKLSDAESDAYFNKRPSSSKLSAAVSQQSQVVASRQAMQNEISALRSDLGQQDASRPERWGGYRLAPSKIEFWQGRDDRLHDRFTYRHVDNQWIIERLYP